jgi:ribosomal protein S14
VSARAVWDDDTADLVALVWLAREDTLTPARREAMRAVVDNCDRDGVLASAVKLLAELVTDLGLCQPCFREYARRAVART